MARPRKLNRTAVRAIFRSRDTAAEIAPRYHVSTALISQIRQGRRYRDVTRSLKAPERSRGRRRGEHLTRSRARSRGTSNPKRRGQGIARHRREPIGLSRIVDAVIARLMMRLLRSRG
jgi:hypothetical protein